MEMKLNVGVSADTLSVAIAASKFLGEPLERMLVRGVEDAAKEAGMYDSKTCDLDNDVFEICFLIYCILVDKNFNALWFRKGFKYEDLSKTTQVSIDMYCHDINLKRCKAIRVLNRSFKSIGVVNLIKKGASNDAKRGEKKWE